MTASRILVTLSLLAVSACARAGADEPCPDVDLTPEPEPDTGDTGDTGEPAEDTMALDLEMGGYAFSGTLPGTEDVESGDSCAGECCRCLTLSDGHAVVTFYGDTVETVEFTYLTQATGSYNVELLYLWTAARAQGLGSYASAYLIVERQNSAPVVLELGECIGH